MTAQTRTPLSPREILDLAVTEREFQAMVIDLAHVLGYRVAHFRPAKTERGWRTPVQGDGLGFPDTILVGRGRVIVAELKRVGARASAEQLAWLAAFTDAGVDAFVWTPADLTSGAIEEALR